MQIRKKFLSLLLVLCMLTSLIPANAYALDNPDDIDTDSSAFDSNFMMTIKGTDRNAYLTTPGFDVFLSNTNFDRTFGDQKCSSMEMILQGQRIATDGDIRLSSTPEQWDPVPAIKSHGPDFANNMLVANESYTDYNLSYNMKVSPEPGGFKVSVNLDNPLPDNLAGRAGFNLEFLPSVYKNKTYTVDSGVGSGVIPTSATSPMTEQPKITDDPITRLDWQAAWDLERQDYQPTPIVTAQSNITLAPEDLTSRVEITSDNNQPLSLYDGRNKAQNGWFVLRTMIPKGKTTDAVVWHVRPSVPKNWARSPMVSYSQVGYIPNGLKTAVIELDPKFNAPAVASIDRLNSDGTFTEVFTGPISTDPISYARYKYAKFDFSSVTTPGTYAINYAGKRTDVFPISENAYSNIWQASLGTYMTEQMDHTAVTEGYRIWHGAAHLDDARQAPANISWFDGWSMGSDLQSPYKPGEHINGLNVGGWFDAGDFDIQTGSHISILQNLAIASKAFNLSYDNTTVDESARTAEMHRPDGIPDGVQQVRHGALQILAQINSVGHTFNVIEVPTLKQYTHLGDGSTDTDGLVYSTTLADQKGYSNVPDDRWAFTGSNLDSSAYVSLAAAAWALRGWDNDMYQKCLTTAQKIWAKQNHTGTGDYSGAVFLMLATYDPKNPDAYADYKNRILASTSALSGNNVDPLWQSSLILPYMDSSFKDTLTAGITNYIKSFDSQMASKPYGVPTSDGMWGGSESVVNVARNMYFLHKASPDIVSGEYTLRAANYILGMHPYSSLSYVCGVGKNSKVHAYSNNRPDDTFIPGGVVPGYVMIAPDYPECIDNFGMMWFENETNTTDAAAWIVAGLGADAIASELSGKPNHQVTFKLSDTTSAVIEGAKINIVGDSATYQTSPTGEAIISLKAGTYDYTISKDGFNTFKGTVDVADSDLSITKTLTFNMSPTSVKINGIDFKNYNPSVTNYNVGANLVPVVTAQSYEGVNVSVTQATALPGKATITLERAGNTAVYTLNFREPPKLTSLSVGGTPVAGFNAGVNDYFVQLSSGYSSFPTVTGTADAKYTVTVVPADATTMKATVTVQDGDITSTYTVGFGTMSSIDFSTIKSEAQLNAKGWSILNLNAPKVKYVDSGITVLSEKGDMYQTPNTIKNVITFNDASGDWQADLEVATDRPFYENYQQGGITAYQDLDNFVKLDTEFNQWSGGLSCQFGSEVGGTFNGKSAKFTMTKGADGSYPIFYRLVRKGDSYSAYISTDGKNYTSSGTVTNKLTNVKLGLVAMNNVTDDPIAVNFKKLTVTHPTSSDKATLQNLYSTGIAIAQGNYTDASWAAFATALKNAKTVLDSSNTTPTEIAQTVNALAAAQSGLTAKVTTDKSALQNLYNSCAQTTQGNYTDASWTIFRTAVNNAKTVLDNIGATQDQINASVTALTAARNALRQKSSGGSTSGGSSSSGSSNASSGTTTTTTPSTVTTTQTTTGSTVATVATQPDAVPTVTGSQSDVAVTVPADVASVISTATATKPAEVRVAAPTASIVEQLTNAAVTKVALTVTVPAEVANNTNANAKVTIDVAATILQTAKAAKKDVTVQVLNSTTGRSAYSWTFTGANLTYSAASLTSVNLALTVASAKNDMAAAAVTAGNTSDKKPAGIVLNFAHRGMLPAPALVRAYVGDQPGVAPLSKMYMYYVNTLTKTLEQLPQSEFTVDGQGYVTVPIPHCSEYVLLPKPATNAYAVKSDTWNAVGVKSGKTYTYAMTVSGKAVPTFTIGNGKAFALTVKRYGNKYYVTVKATGAAGTMTAVYSTFPGQKPVVMGYAAVAK